MLAPHTRQHFHPSQLLPAHLCPPQSDLLLEVLLRGHFYLGQKGTLLSWRNMGCSPKTHTNDMIQSPVRAVSSNPIAKVLSERGLAVDNFPARPKYVLGRLHNQVSVPLPGL